MPIATLSTPDFTPAAVTPGYRGPATYSQPVGSLNFVTDLGADPTGVTNCLTIFQDWYADGGRSLYIPAGTYNFTWPDGNPNALGILYDESIQIVGAGEALVDLVFGPADWQAENMTMIWLFCNGACDTTLKGFNVIGPGVPDPLYYEQTTTTIFFQGTVVSSTPTNLTVRHVTWEGLTNAFSTFAGATTPTTIDMEDIVSSTEWCGMTFYRGDQGYHVLSVRYADFVKWGLPGAKNPYSGGAVGHAIYTHGNLNYYFQAIDWINSFTGHQGYSLDVGGNQSAVPSYQIIEDCIIHGNTGGFTLNTNHRASVTRLTVDNYANASALYTSTNGCDFYDCTFDTNSMFPSSVGSTVNFYNCNFQRIGFWIANAPNTTVRVVGGATVLPSSISAPSYQWKISGASTAASSIEFIDHPFTSQITADGGALGLFYADGGTFTFTRCDISGEWRPTPGSAVAQIIGGSAFQSMTLTDCVFDISTDYIAAIGGSAYGHDVLFTVGCTFNGAQVDDPNGEWSNTP